DRLYRRSLFPQRHAPHPPRTERRTVAGRSMTGNLWVIFTLIGAAGQTARNAMQRELTPRLGALGATLVRFLFGFPFALAFLAAAMAASRGHLPIMNIGFAAWTVPGAVT